MKDNDKRCKYDWKQIQAEYDSGLSTRELGKKHGIVQASFRNAKERGEFVPRNKKDAAAMRLKLHGATTKVHSAESRKKISQARIKFLAANPDKVPYRINHSSKESYPEKIFRIGLESSGITGWVTNYQHGIYEYDFAFPDLKLDVEIDGGTHLSEKVKLIDARRDQWSQEQGWTVLRFTAREVKLDLVGCLNKLKTYHSESVSGDL
jgi:very-short-patch-repair endonuclease